MPSRRVVPVLLASLIVSVAMMVHLAATASSSGEGEAPARKTSCSVTLHEAQTLATALSAALEEAGLSVFFDPASQYLDFAQTCTAEKPSCYFQNPTSPYGKLTTPGVLPPFGFSTFLNPSSLFLHLLSGVQRLRAFLGSVFNQVRDHHEAEADGGKKAAVEALKASVYQPGKVSAYTLNPWHAWLFFGCTPPPSKYFGIQTYVFTSDGHVVFGDVGDAINFHDFNTSSGPLAPFASRFLFLSTPNDAVREIIVTALQNLESNDGPSLLRVNVELIPSTESLHIQSLGYDPRSHPTFGTLFRLALCDPAYQTDCDAYLAQPPIFVYRIFQSSIWWQPNIPVVTHPLTYKPRGTGETEVFLQDTFEKLRQAARNYFVQNTGLEFHSESVFIPAMIDSTICRMNKTNCQGDTRDTLYMHGGHGPLGYSDLAIIAGVLHADERVGKATYTNVASYCMKRELGMAAFTGEQLANSTSTVLEEVFGADGFDRTEAGSLYLLAINRNCTAFAEAYPTSSVPCLQIEDETHFPGCAIESEVFFVERSYLEKKTGVGPDPEELIPAHFFFFQRHPDASPPMHDEL